MDLRLGISAWLAAAAHEVPQELGDRDGAPSLNMPSGLQELHRAAEVRSRTIRNRIGATRQVAALTKTMAL
jgi:hypothetical protein